MSASDLVPAGRSDHRRSGLRFSDSFTWAEGSMTQNATCPGIGPPSAKAVLVSFISLLPMRRNRLVEVGQRFHPALPCLQLRRQQSLGVEVRQLHLATPHEGNRGIKR